MVLSKLVDRIVSDGKLTSEEFRLFREAVDADGKIDMEEIQQINRLFSMIEDGQLVFVD